MGKGKTQILTIGPRRPGVARDRVTISVYPIVSVRVHRRTCVMLFHHLAPPKIIISIEGAKPNGKGKVEEKASGH